MVILLKRLSGAAKRVATLHGHRPKPLVDPATYFLTTMSVFVLSTMAINSCCSFAGTT
jgi:hypothetical protein